MQMTATVWKVVLVASCSVIINLPGLAQDAKETTNCPIQILKADPAAGEHSEVMGPGLPLLRGGVDLRIEFTNSGEKDIKGAKFEVNFIDSVGDRHESPETYNGQGNIKPGKKTKWSWRNIFWDEYQNHKIEAWPTKILFSDGTSWEDGGAHSCKFATDK